MIIPRPLQAQGVNLEQQLTSFVNNFLLSKGWRLITNMNNNYF
jgi:hypothetical protein